MLQHVSATTGKKYCKKHVHKPLISRMHVPAQIVLPFRLIHPPIPGQIVQGNGLDSELKHAGNYATGSPCRVTELAQTRCFVRVIQCLVKKEVLDGLD